MRSPCWAGGKPDRANRRGDAGASSAGNKGNGSANMNCPNCKAETITQIENGTEIAFCTECDWAEEVLCGGYLEPQDS